jgi:CheY-like chemotaxis protein
MRGPFYCHVPPNTAHGALALRSLSQPDQPPPDAILLDMIMPVVNGWQFAAAYR